ncbi:MAG: hypothetical protein NVV74_13040 [Magnetospirillum sp.]|nr:hypothetical protein [Magnetospirillum sp.]
MLAAVRRTISPLPAMEVLGPVSCLRMPFAPGLSPLVLAATQTVAALLAREFGGIRRDRRRGAVCA